MGFRVSLGLFHWGFLKLCFLVQNYFLSQILSSYTGRQFMANESKSNILSPTPSTDQERTPTFWHLPAARMHASSTWTSHNILINRIWNGQGFGAMRRNQPPGQSKSVALGLSERTAEDHLQWLNTTLHNLLSCPCLSAFSQDVLHDSACSLSFPEQSTVVKTSVWGSVWLRSLGGFVTWFRTLQVP